MAAQQLTFHGINRAVSDYAASGSCEELINLRPTTEGLVPVRPFGDLFEGLTYDAFYEHKASNATNYIGISIDHAEDDLIVTFLDDEGTQIVSPVAIADISYQANLSADDIHFAYAGNYVLFSISYKASGLNEKDLYLNACFLWNGSEYVKRDADIPSITAGIYVTERNPVTLDTLPVAASSSDHAAFVDALDNAFNEIQENYKDTCFGPTVIALALKTKDGNTFWTFNRMIFDPSTNRMAELGTYYYLPTTSFYQGTFQDYFPSFCNAYGGGYLVSRSTEAKLVGAKVELRIKLESQWDEEESMLESVEVYASRPKLYIDTDRLLSNDEGLTFDNYAGLIGGYSFCFLPRESYGKMNLGDQLLYLQDSIPIDLIKRQGTNPYVVKLHFGGNIQTTSKTMPVDAGQTTRYGDIISYNARFHFFDSVRKMELPVPTFYLSDGTIAGTTPGTRLMKSDIFVTVNDGVKDKNYYVGIRYLPVMSSVTDPDGISFIFSNSVQIKQVIALYYDSTQPTYSFALMYNMSPSVNYNYTFYDGDENSRVTLDYSQIGELVDLLDDGVTSSIFTDEPSAINVTEQYNPFVFNVDNSYLAPGKVLNLQPQMMAVPDVSYGDYPLNIFTERGVYALLQGDGSVLYGAMRPISNLVAQSNGIPTENGTFFLAAGGMWVIAGSKAILVSDALSLGPHKYIRNNDGYKNLCGDSVVTSVGYDVHEYLSAVEFKDYIVNDPGAKLSYNRFRDEIYVSNFNYKYSYALSLKYRQWFKIDLKLAQDVPGASIALTPHTETDTGKPWDVLDFSYENKSSDILVHLQSRPIAPNGYQYAHIHRVIQMMRAELLSRFVLSVYGSDDLQNWTLVTYASRQGNTTETPIKRLKVSQVRTPSCARSWRYYTICFGGSVPATDTDFGPTLIDFEPVIRRIG